MSLQSRLKYQEARGYAYKLSPTTYTDIVHDAYIQWKEHTGKDLFEEERRLITTIIKNLVWKQFERGNFMYRGKIYPKSYTPAVSDAPNDPDTRYFIPTTHENPEDIFMKNEMSDAFFEKLRKNLSDDEKFILEAYMNGYDKTEIAFEIGVSSTTFTKRWKIILEKLKKGLA